MEGGSEKAGRRGGGVWIGVGVEEVDPPNRVRRRSGSTSRHFGARLPLPLQAIVVDVDAQRAPEHPRDLALHPFLLVGDHLGEPPPDAREAIDERMAHIVADTETKQPHVPARGLPLDEIQQLLRVPDLSVGEEHDLEHAVISAVGEGGADGGEDLGAAQIGRHPVDVPLGLCEGAIRVRAGLGPEEGACRAEGADVEVHAEREGFEEDGEGGFEWGDAGAHAA